MATILSKELNRFARTYFVKGNEPRDIDPVKFLSEVMSINARLVQDLVLHEKVSLKVYGENIPLAAMIGHFGLGTVYELLEQDALEFVLWTPVVTYNVDPIEGLHPLQSGRQSSAAHSDPLESAETGLEWMKEPLATKERKKLALLAADRYKLPSDKVAGDSAELVLDAYSQGLLSPLGMPATKELDRLTRDERARLANIADSVLESLVLADMGYSSTDSPDVTAIVQGELTNLAAADVITDYMNQLCAIENVPDIHRLAMTGVISPGEVVELRNSRHAVKLRGWLNERYEQGTVPEEISRAYLDEITDGSGLGASGPGRLTRVMLVFVLGTLVGGAVAGPPGMAAGLGLSMLDEFFLSSYLKGWNPRFFFDEEMRSRLQGIQDQKELPPGQ